jgi:hypothetical protein
LPVAVDEHAASNANAAATARTRTVRIGPAPYARAPAPSTGSVAAQVVARYEGYAQRRATTPAAACSRNRAA